MNGENILEKAKEDLEASFDLARAQFVEDTRKAFELAFQGTPTMVEHVRHLYSNGQVRVSLQPTFEAILDGLEYTDALNSFFAVLKKSRCPLVGALKEELIKHYIESNADEVAELRAEV